MRARLKRYVVSCGLGASAASLAGGIVAQSVNSLLISIILFLSMLAIDGVEITVKPRRTRSKKEKTRE